MALGANPKDVQKLVVGQGLLLALIGVVAGLIGAYGLTRFMIALLYDTKATDPATFVGTAAILIMIAMAACYIPARRASKVDPMIALRYD
jgi:putative ABC transport system permease protein